MDAAVGALRSTKAAQRRGIGSLAGVNRASAHLGNTFAVVTLALAGCGGSDEDASSGKEADARSDVVDVVKRYQTATLESDGQTFCDLLTGKAKRDLVVQFAALSPTGDCEKAATRIFDLAGRDEIAQVKRARKTLTLSDVTLTGRRASVRLDSGRRLRLAHTGAGWLVSSVKVR